MEQVIVSSHDPVTLLGGSDHAEADLAEAMAHAPLLVAADGGGDRALLAGQRPAAVIGDMDSLSASAREILADVLHPVSEQETTDFDKALRAIAAPLVLAVGVSGGRFDHELAALTVLARHPDRPCLVIGRESLVFLCPPRLRLDTAPGTTVSIFPLVAGRVESEGLEWPTTGLDLAPDGRIGTSNRATGPVALAPEAPQMLVILPRDQLAVAVRALLAQVGVASGRWPARAG
ncbi:thiamine diphosphokinase [Salibaculum griseiflavum]|uniref:Thiamine diphosphokinase n=1 Tax=Salibaculum griseiflavum TaxID=1914409 RepID=A0A2V1P535_9RHOB|nr:thiamine diphosphokinase [Salibaculum griseiflavum]